ncbi:hypothetical protein NIES4101_51840 [Calothrix sp. NIES-4101]|nr:hypothetical protein NIES4101_51840 [Calothrix sp. NIES-4101]
MHLPQHLTSIDQFFPPEEQRKYVLQLQGRVGLTRRRAEYFVKLWAYLLLKQQYALGKQPKLPLTQLDLPEGFVACTHRETQEIFYGDSERGSDRAAGMMIDKLVGLGLIEKNFDGNNICLKVRWRQPLLHSSNPENTGKNSETIQLIPDAFNPRIDTIPVASFLAHYYNWINKKNTIVPHRIARILRTWANHYPTGMRVLRHPDTQNAVAFYILYPVAAESEEIFFLPPGKSLYLNTDLEIDPIKMAQPGDTSCTSLHVRGWQIDFPYKNHNSIQQLLTDAIKTLGVVHKDFPNLCDIYTLPMHPADQQLASALSFQNTTPDQMRSLCWMYIALDKFVSIDIERAMSTLKFE